MASGSRNGNMSESTTSTTIQQPTQTYLDGAEKTEVRVVVIGNVDSGKSTLVGVLSKGANDDGRGLARSYVFNYDHERASGRTSSISHEIMCFSPDGSQLLPDRLSDSKNLLWQRLINPSHHIISLLDLCGHEKYLKTTMFGLVGLIPDYALIVIGANSGLTRITKEHLGLAIALKIPVLVAITKIDIAPKEITEETIATVQKILRSAGAGSRFPLVIREEDDLKQVVEGMEARVTPVFLVSSVTGQGVTQLRELMGRLTPRGVQCGLIGKADDPVEVQIDSVYSVPGVGLAVSGVVRAGTIHLNQVLLLGPDRNGGFKAVTVRGIHFYRVQVEGVVAGQSCCLAIKAKNRGEQVTKATFRKGMLLVDPNHKPQAVWEFDSEVVILHHSTTILPNYQSVVHTGVVTQCAKVVSLSKSPLITGDKGLVRFRFLYNPEVLHPGAVLLFREGRTKGLGVISSLYPT